MSCKRASLGYRVLNSENVIASFESFRNENHADVNFEEIKADAIRTENKKMGKVYKAMQWAYDMGGNLKQSEYAGFCNMAYTALQMLKNEVLK